MARSTTPDDMEQPVTRTVADAIIEGMKAIAPVKKKTMGSYDPKSPFHPDKKKASKLREDRVYLQNGARIEAVRTYDAEIDLLNEIHKPGLYCNGLVEVAISKRGSKEVVELVYANATPDQTMELMQVAPSLLAMLRQIVNAQEESAA